MQTTALPPNVQTAILFYLAREARLCASDCRRLEVGLLRPDQLERLGRLRVEDVEFFERLILDSKPLLRVECDPGRLDSALFRLEARQADTDLTDQLILRGASAAMLMAIGRIGYRELMTRRKALAIESKNGRPKIPDEATQIKIYHTWKSLGHPDVRRRYIDLHDRFPELPLGVLWAVNQQNP